VKTVFCFHREMEEIRVLQNCTAEIYLNMNIKLCNILESKSRKYHIKSNLKYIYYICYGLLFEVMSLSPPAFMHLIYNTVYRMHLE
jgi:hypothetical protein